MMNKNMQRIISVCLLAVSGVLFFSCASSKAAPAAGHSGSSVWKISKNGNTLFLGGSIHVLRDDDFPLPPQYDLAYAQSARLVLETDVELLETEEMANYMMSQMFLPGGETLQTILSPDTYALLTEKSLAYGFRIEVVSNFKPSMVIMLLTMLQIQELGYTQQGIDYHYLYKAKNDNKPVEYLESVESQIHMVVTMGEGYENDYVLYSLQDMDSSETVLDTILADWRTGEPASSETSLEEMRADWPVMYKTLVTDRNEAWIPQIERFLDSGTVYFVVAGLLHMHGPDGLLRLLKDKGYTIEQL